MENDPKDDSSLSALIDAVADGRDVDWDEADTTARNSPERLLIRNLRILSRLKQFFGNPDACDRGGAGCAGGGVST